MSALGQSVRRKVEPLRPCEVHAMFDACNSYSTPSHWRVEG